MRSAKFLVCCKSKLNHKSYPRRDGGKETGKTGGQARSQKGNNENKMQLMQVDLFCIKCMKRQSKKDCFKKGCSYRIPIAFINGGTV